MSGSTIFFRLRQSPAVSPSSIFCAAEGMGFELDTQPPHVSTPWGGAGRGGLRTSTWTIFVTFPYVIDSWVLGPKFLLRHDAFQAKLFISPEGNVDF